MVTKWYLYVLFVLCCLFAARPKSKIPKSSWKISYVPIICYFLKVSVHCFVGLHDTGLSWRPLTAVMSFGSPGGGAINYKPTP
jgi:hypothetical protein